MVNDFTTKHAQDKVDYYMGMVAEEQSIFEGLVEHMQDADNQDNTWQDNQRSYGQSQKTQETKDAFTNDLQVLSRKIIVWKPSFHLKTNHQLKAQHVYKLWDPYYAAMACNALQSSPEEETFTRFSGCLVTLLGWHMKQTISSVASTGFNPEISKIGSKLSKNSRQWQNKINKQDPQISCLQNQNEQKRGLLDPILLVDAIIQAVTTSLKVNSQPVNKDSSGNNGTRYISRPYLGKPGLHNWHQGLIGH